MSTKKWIFFGLFLILVGLVFFFFAYLLPRRGTGTAQPQPGTTPVPTWEVAETPPDLPLYLYIQGGAFIMGSAEDDPAAREDEKPQHSVRLPGYWIMTREVTNLMYALCVQTGQCTPPQGEGNHFGDEKFDEFPVTGVTWAQAEAYCAANDAHLPTEAEWEKAARGFFGNRYPWGTASPDCTLANLDSCGGELDPTGVREGGTSPFDIHDMIGNAHEWVADWYDPDAYGSDDGFMPAGPDTGTLRSIRGNSYMDTFADSRASIRLFSEPENYQQDLGFRCVRNTRVYQSFCSTSYRSFCTPQHEGDDPDQPCDPGTQVEYQNGAKVSIGCPDNNGNGTIKILFSQPVSQVLSVTANGAGMDCNLSQDGTYYGCNGPIPPSGSDVTVEICAVSVPQALQDGNIGIEEVSCFSITQPVAIGDTITYAKDTPVMNLLPGLPVTSMLQMADGYCPDGFVWDSVQMMCIGQGISVNEIPPGTENYCLEGYYFNTGLQCCLPGTDISGACPPGSYYDPLKLSCVQGTVGQCPQGCIYDPYKGCICMKQPIDGPEIADEPAVTCPPGMVYVEGQGCVTEPKLSMCKEGYYEVGGTCYPLPENGCQPGTYKDPVTGQCLPVTGPLSGCPQGYMMDPKTLCCTPIPGMDNTLCPGDDGQSYWDPAQGNCDPPEGLQCPPYMHANPNNPQQCVPNYECPEGTGPTPNNPDGCFPPGGGNNCPPGYVFNTTGQGCVPDYGVQCGDTQYYDPVIGLCRDLTDDCCGVGYYYNEQYKLCLPFPLSDECPPGYFFKDPECLPYAKEVTFCTSVVAQVPQCQTECPPGTHWSVNQQACLKDNQCAGVVCSQYDPKVCPLNCCRIADVANICVEK